MEVTRIIHPIGQGAFYTESIKTNDNLYNVVYDCIMFPFVWTGVKSS